jgi:hypothetical protein
MDRILTERHQQRPAIIGYAQRAKCTCTGERLLTKLDDGIDAQILVLVDNVRFPQFR